MRKTRLFFILIALVTFASCSKDNTETDIPEIQDPISNLDGPIAKPTTGYGSDGTYIVSKTSFENPLFANKNVEIFHPMDVTTSNPTIFYAHPFGGNKSANYDGLFNFLSSKGYVVVYVPYPTIGATVEERYNTLWAGFEKAVTDYPELIDTTKVGFVGFSFGGGASFGLAHKGFVEKGWGENGRFIFAMAQWYSYQLTDIQLISFPENTKLITQVYEDDDINDHRMAIDIFNSINISTSEKDFIMIESDEIDGYQFTTEHALSETSDKFDAYDYYGIYRILDALIDYSFNGNLNAKDIALGGGSSAQVTMPKHGTETLTPLSVTDNPMPIHDQSFYQFPCADDANPRSICN
ncbi:alpha/beta hydrolase [Aurantibacter sp.]|uniref:alpha/beta hydrolase family protein n=1 Tax=Aurantibacter sp. TaxID=2807103 RepID=UPI00326354C8